MEVTRSKSSKDKGPAQSAPVPAHIILPQPTYADVKAMLEAAQVEATLRYEHIPLLHNELQTQYGQGIEECDEKVRGEARKPPDLLLARLRGERYVCDAFNKHRLGQAKWRYYEAKPAPEEKDGRLTELGEDIDEDLESFPLRLEAVIRGFDAFTENLAPIYQVIDGAARPPAKTESLPTTSEIRGLETASTPPKVATSSKGRSNNNYDKLLGAPVPNLDFPVGNITIAEMAAFHPEAIKSCDVINRFCRNGGTQASFATMINHFRAMDRGPIENNTVLRSMQGSMRKRAKAEPAYAKWKATIHHQFAQPGNFNPASVSVTGFSHSGDGKTKTTALPILIRDMAKGVEIFPTNDDALDLTRAVQYCLYHPDEDWLYPKDYERLVNQLPHDEDQEDSPIGPLPVRAGHQDRAVISRYVSTRRPAGVHRGYGRQPKVDQDSDEGDVDNVDTASDENLDKDTNFDSRNRKDNKRKRFADDSDSDEVHTRTRKQIKKRKTLTPKLRESRNTTKDTLTRPSRLQSQLSIDSLDTDSDGDTYVDPKRADKVKKQVVKPRRSGRATKVKHTYSIEEATALHDEEYDMPSWMHGTNSNMIGGGVYEDED